MNGANFKQGLNAGLAAGGISGTIGGVIGGALGGISAMKKQGNFFTGKGAISIEESISDVSELGGDYFSDDELMKEYIESQIGWSEGDYGIMNISVEADPQMMTLGSEYYRGDGGSYGIRRIDKNSECRNLSFSSSVYLYVSSSIIIWFCSYS